MDISLKTYTSGFSHSYAIGVFPALELIAHHPGSVLKILIHSKADRNSGVDKIRAFAGVNNISTEINDQAIAKLSHSENCYAVGIFAKYKSPVSPNRNHLILINPADMGNLGTIIRTMVGFGVQDLILIRPAPDIFDPKVIRASMGAVFQINFSYFDDFSGYQNSFTHHLYPFMVDGKVTLDELKLQFPYALIFGNEGAGLSPQFHEYGTSVRIPQTEDIDSLNLSVSAALALYYAYKSI
jgi:TrmH family RNA methyltransferase